MFGRTLPGPYYRKRPTLVRKRVREAFGLFGSGTQGGPGRRFDRAGQVKAVDYSTLCQIGTDAGPWQKGASDHRRGQRDCKGGGGEKEKEVPPRLPLLPAGAAGPAPLVRTAGRGARGGRVGHARGAGVATRNRYVFPIAAPEASKVGSQIFRSLQNCNDS